MGATLTRKRVGGFSLAEVILAAGAIGVCILTLLALMLSLSRSSRKSVDASAAYMAADQILTRVVYEAQCNDHANFWGTASFTPYKQGVLRMNRTDFTYTLDAVTATNTSGGAVGTGTGMTQNRLKLVTVHVSWWDGNAGNRTGYGLLKREACRVVREETP